MIKYISTILLSSTLILSAASPPTNVVKITELPAASSLSTNDLFPVVTDPGTSPVTRKARLWDVVGNALGASNFVVTVNSMITNISNYLLTNNIHIVTGSTNLIIVTNVVGNVTTYTFILTNVSSGSSTNAFSSVWTNNVNRLHPIADGLLKTNTIQIYDQNGGIGLGEATLSYWSNVPGENGESLVSVRNIGPPFNEIDFNEIFIGVIDGANEIYQDHLISSTLNTRIHKMTILGQPLTINEFIDSAGRFVYRAFNGTSDAWSFNPGVFGSPSYIFNTTVDVETNDMLVVFRNNTTNKFELYGDGRAFFYNNVGIKTNLSAYPLSVHATDITQPAINITYNTGAGTPGPQAIQLHNGTGNTNFYVTTSGSGYFASGVAIGSNTYASGLYVDGPIKAPTLTGTGGILAWNNGEVVRTNTVAGSSNFINLSVQAAKLPGNDNPGIGSGYKNWELIFYKTNIAGAIAPLSANWQFVVPPDYSTNSLLLYIQQMILQTNGPATSNTIFRASVFKSTPGDSIDIHTNNIFYSKVPVTNIWSASNSGTNIIQNSLITFGTNAPIQAGDFVVLNLERNATNDTYMWEAAVVGLQLLYKRQ